jgi:hypothetical protein
MRIRSSERSQIQLGSANPPMTNEKWKMTNGKSAF